MLIDWRCGGSLIGDVVCGGSLIEDVEAYWLEIWWFIAWRCDGSLAGDVAAHW